MNAKKMLCTVLACISLIGSLTCTAAAAPKDSEIQVKQVMEIGTPWASGAFSMTISAKSKGVADSSFPLDEGETVSINASYYPDASVDFGLVGDDGVFHYFNVTDGSIDKTIRISERGNYTLQIRNNSSKGISVSGYVRY